MKRLRFLLILLLTACAAPTQMPDVTLEDQAPPGEFLLRANLFDHRVTLQTATVQSPSRIIIERNAFSGPVFLSLEQRDGTVLPTGISARFLANNASASVSTLIISLGTQVTPKTYALRVKGVSGSLIKYASMNLIVSPVSSNWMPCVPNTWPECNFEGLHEVRLSANGKYVSKLFFDYAGCNPVHFDNIDPAPGFAPTCSYGPMKTKKIANPNPANGLGNTVTVPLGDPGSIEMRVRATDQNPYPNGGVGYFRVFCQYSHMAFDDPIVYPNQPGASHLHTFFGNTRASAASTSNSIARSGNSSCQGGIANRSSYWIPTLLDAQKQPVVPTLGLMYYKTGFVDFASIQQIPVGLRMIAGNASSSVGQGHNMAWGCVEHDLPDNSGFIPSADACGGPGNHIKLRVVFPQCWDGVNLDSLNHKSHMSYPDPWQGCPSSHPIELPEITINVHYKIPSSGTTGWRLSSDNYSTSLPGGFSLHGDFMNGWRDDIAAMWIRNCIHAALDCNAGLLGEGKALY
jgi:hypothetical protein